jgi:hypothetical protein
LEEEKQSYDLLLVTSTGSFLISHLALEKVETIIEAFTQVNQSNIFANKLFLAVNKNEFERISLFDLKRCSLDNISFTVD